MILRLLAEAGWGQRRIVATRRIGGGCVSDAQLLTLDDDRRVFVKTDHRSRLAMFQCEVEGLRALAACGAIRVAEPITVGQDPLTERAVFMAHAIRVTPPAEGFFETFGRQLAALHRCGIGDRFGWHRDNFLGPARQPNPWCDAWIPFVAQHRLGHQLRSARDERRGTTQLYRAVERVIAKLDDLLSAPAEPPVLLHGDLWSGNYLADADGQPVLIDPAVYYGHREAEFGMLKLFGGCPQAFYDAYHQAHPLADGWQNRCEVYILYHLLNHLNLFGSGYLPQCQGCADRLAR